MFSSFLTIVVWVFLPKQAVVLSQRSSKKLFADNFIYFFYLFFFLLFFFFDDDLNKLHSTFSIKEMLAFKLW